ncbi:MAG: hypothetical protein A2268_06125 [Candidatus Raymondbacteria bacterium RifOxyA12_full_50_37]|uniref:EF-hand domain-containing protein n=1 Tax=Candidatus Raymondbacteria bacterium RIFOXYD12_FULL_49_13 TaxID=1817890 RepID=A0A1F7FKC6_UNCRA|nr:MAG: hypothetical protein A2268_06125 [Candidatus Raymondbacteria bacterium RifOxyA12_full_50_37]OGJ94545.1 MAG: hypothetical protein A2248_15055 [Candidatus Raymondbacteria bacterium RIFOXYA2_FULL_49_16]OGJ98505.1 MAG: hypothetical protein A2487_05410 [Candidatus Raymondbacteria bacterium RifOxyC12_full_50_8]OGK01694.1 MAG: hypothetical protein A2350_10785 [Candidatus Raymondbacteria bacterium RifOxyB12_full_50_8]OGK07021.1 MAG: hypothetical protein A2519_13695 [Candidatus Raymondbacteria b
MSISSIGNVDSSAMMSHMAAKMFKRLDTNEDGGIDKTEMQAMLDQGQGRGQGPSIDEIFEKSDTNKDGKINAEENEKAMEQRRAEMDQMRAEMQNRMASEMFAKLDTNSDGSIDKTEMQAMVDQTNGHGPSVDDIFEKADTNGDGKIDEEENAEAMKNAPPPPLPPQEMSENSSDSGDAISFLIKALSKSDDTESSSIMSKLADTLLEQLDTDANGSIDKNELVASLKETFQQSSYTQEGGLSANLNLSGTLLNAMA